MLKKYTIEDMQKFAISKEGICLSDSYERSNKPLEWQCKNGHKWFAQYSNIKQGSWCPKCCNKKPPKFTLDDIKKFAINKGGKCLSSSYLKTIDKLTWECHLGHKWDACFHDVQRGTWCPTCVYDNNRIYSIDYCKLLALKYNGDCLSKNYKNMKTRLQWICEYKHKWTATLDNVKNKASWCPVCYQSYGEKKFRETIESITHYKFPKVHPKWLLNKKGNRMEIDGFCKELNIGFEYQGQQHIKFVPYWHKTLDKFKKQQETDKLKKSLLKKQGIKMLYPTYKLKFTDFEKFIIKELDDK